MRYAIFTVWHEWRRYMIGILAVGFSTVLIGLQFGITFGLVSLVSLPVDVSTAQIWVASPNTPSCDLGLPIPAEYMNQVERLPEIAQTDECLQGFGFWKNPTEGNSLVIIIGCNLKENTLGPGACLTDHQRVLLSEVGAVILDQWDHRKLGVTHIGQTGEVFGRRVRVVGFMHHLASITGPYVFCSLPTARLLLSAANYSRNHTTYLLATCHDRSQVPSVLAKLNRFPHVTAYSAEGFSFRSRSYWLGTTKAGIAVGFVAILGLTVGVLITSQSLYSATVVSIKEFALLRALGATRGRLRLFVLQQSFLVGMAGLALGVPCTFGLENLAKALGTPAILPGWLLAAACFVTLSMALLAGLFTLRTLKHTEPAQLLR